MTSLPQHPSGCFDGTLHRFPVRAYFDDTDAGGVVYHANYLRWFERARSEMLRLSGIDTRAGLDAGWGTYAITELHIRYLRPAKLGDAVLIESEVIALGAASWRIRQRVLRAGDLLVEATLRIGFVGPNGRARRHPAPWRAVFETILGHRIPV